MKKNLPIITDDEIDKIALAQNREFDAFNIWLVFKFERDNPNAGYFKDNRNKIRLRLNRLAREGKLMRFDDWYKCAKITA